MPNIGQFLSLLYSCLHCLKVLELQLSVYDFFITYRVNTSVYVDNVAVVKTPEHMYDSVTLTYVAQKLVAQTLSLAGSLDETGYVNDVTYCWHDTSRMNEFSELREPLIRHTHLSELSVDGAEREIGCLSLCARQTIEQCRFAHIRQTNNTCF